MSKYVIFVVLPHTRITFPNLYLTGNTLNNVAIVTDITKAVTFNSFLECLFWVTVVKNSNLFIGHDLYPRILES